MSGAGGRYSIKKHLHIMTKKTTFPFLLLIQFERISPYGQGAGSETLEEAGGHSNDEPRDWGKTTALGCFFLCKLCSGKKDKM